MQTFTFSDGHEYKGVMAKVRINREEIRECIILRCSRQASQVMAEYDRSLRLNEALLTIFSERHPELAESEGIAAYNAWEPTREQIEDAEFIVDNRVILTTGLREVVNDEIPVYFSARLTAKMNGMPVFVQFVPKEQRVENQQPSEFARNPVSTATPSAVFADSF